MRQESLEVRGPEDPLVPVGCQDNEEQPEIQYALIQELLCAKFIPFCWLIHSFLHDSFINREEMVLQEERVPLDLMVPLVLMGVQVHLDLMVLL